jgi:hypothetical protein
MAYFDFILSFLYRLTAVKINLEMLPLKEALAFSLNIVRSASVSLIVTRQVRMGMGCFVFLAFILSVFFVGQKFRFSLKGDASFEHSTTL